MKPMRCAISPSRVVAGPNKAQSTPPVIAKAAGVPPQHLPAAHEAGSESLALLFLDAGASAALNLPAQQTGRVWLS
jgi:hypothetical protein